MPRACAGSRNWPGVSRAWKRGSTGQRREKRSLTSLDIDRIRQILPHRYPFLLLDRVVEHRGGEWLKAVKNVTISEPCFEGHFPHRPVMPGVLILEAMAQASAVLASIAEQATASTNAVYLFAGIDKARFKRQVRPGDCLEIEITMLRKRQSLWKCGATASVDGKLCCSADLLFTYQEN